MKIIYNKVIPFGKDFYAINLFGILFAKGPCDEVTLNHESIHTAQMKDGDTFSIILSIALNGSSV